MPVLLYTEIPHVQYKAFEPSYPTSLDGHGNLCIDLTAKPDWHDGKCIVDLTKTRKAINVALGEELEDDKMAKDI